MQMHPSLRTAQLVPKSFSTYGYVYDVKSRKLIEVEGARSAGAAS